MDKVHRPLRRVRPRTGGPLALQRAARLRLLRRAGGGVRLGLGGTRTGLSPCFWPRTCSVCEAVSQRNGRGAAHLGAVEHPWPGQNNSGFCRLVPSVPTQKRDLMWQTLGICNPWAGADRSGRPHPRPLRLHRRRRRLHRRSHRRRKSSAARACAAAAALLGCPTARCSLAALPPP